MQRTWRCWWRSRADGTSAARMIGSRCDAWPEKTYCWPDLPPRPVAIADRASMMLDNAVWNSVGASARISLSCVTASFAALELVPAAAISTADLSTPVEVRSLHTAEAVGVTLLERASVAGE